MMGAREKWKNVLMIVRNPNMDIGNDTSNLSAWQETGIGLIFHEMKETVSGTIALPINIVVAVQK